MKRTLMIVVLLVFLVSSFGSSALAAAPHSRKICSTKHAAGTARCHAIILTDSGGVQPLATGTPQGYGPTNFRQAYGVQLRANTTVGIIDAYDAPNIQADVNSYSKFFGIATLPVCASAGQNGCLEKLNQHGTTKYPATNSSWSVETSLDVETVHGLCPGCRIELIEASSASMSNLGAAVDEAINRGAQVISNSYGGNESATETSYDRHYIHPGIAMVVSSGDSGYGTNYPAASPGVIAVGGTTLKMNGSRVVSEVAWSGAGSGCSAYEPKPAWQHDKRCTQRSIADVAADADPTTGAAIFDSYPTSGRSGWFTVGGTSLAAPLVAGIIAASGTINNQPAYLYGNSASVIRDIVTGTNGTCPISYLCKATTGYDGPTGLGVLSHL